MDDDVVMRQARKAKQMLDSAGSVSARVKAASTSREGWCVIAWGVCAASYLAVLFATRSDGVSDVPWLFLSIAVLLVALFVRAVSKANRTVRPRFYPFLEGSAGLGTAVIASILLSATEERNLPVVEAAVLGLACSAPIFACGSWLVVRRR